MDELVLKHSNIKEILAIYPGYYNTKMNLALDDDEDFKWNITKQNDYSFTHHQVSLDGTSFITTAPEKSIIF